MRASQASDLRIVIHPGSHQVPKLGPSSEKSSGAEMLPGYVRKMDHTLRFSFRSGVFRGAPANAKTAVFMAWRPGAIAA